MIVNVQASPSAMEIMSLSSLRVVLHTLANSACCMQTVAQNVAQLDYMRHAMKTKDAEIDVLKKKWQEYQEVQDRLSGYEKDRLGEKDLLRKRAEQIDALQHKVRPHNNKTPGPRQQLNLTAELCRLLNHRRLQPIAAQSEEAILSKVAQDSRVKGNKGCILVIALILGIVWPAVHHQSSAISQYDSLQNEPHCT